MESPSSTTRAGDAVPPDLEAVDALERAGRLADAVDALAAVNRTDPSAELQIRLVDLRHRAAQEIRSTGRSPWPPVYPDPFPEVVGRPPEISAGQLDAETVGGCIAHHGSVIVRGLFDPDQVERTRASTLAAFDAQTTAVDGGSDATLRPFPHVTPMDRKLRKMIVDRGGTWLGDSPAATAQVLDDLGAAGAIDLVTRHFGERPLFSLQKSTLRRVQPEYRFTGWHQDGSFLGAETRSLNVWIALTPCGGLRPAPGLEIVPRRIEHILDTDGDTGSASINGYAVHFAAGDTPVMQPEFDAGDSLIFDERMVHRTYLSHDMTEERLALECWFFAPSHFAETYVSMLV